MFESSDDINIDDEFLSGIFEVEQEAIGINNASRTDSNCSFNTQKMLSDCIMKENMTRNLDASSANSLLTPRPINYSPTPVKQVNIFESSGSNVKSGAYFEIHQGNKENKRKHPSSPLPSKSKKERRFPGPAGLLPERKFSRDTPIKLDYILEPDKSPSNSIPEELCSQGRCSGSILEEEPWKNLLADLGSDRKILDVVNVASVKRKAAARCFVGKKVPFLAAVLHHLDVSSPDPCIILRDCTGEIHGTLHRDVWEQFAGELVVGSVLVIRNVGILSTGISFRRHYLNITANNLVTIYTANPDKSEKTQLLHPLTVHNFDQTIEHWHSLVSPSYGIGSPLSVGSPGLFNSSLCSPLNNNILQTPGTSNPKRYDDTPRRTAVNQKSLNVPQGSKVQQVTQQNVHYNNNSAFTPTQTPKHTFLSRPLVKNLLPSFVPKSQLSSCNNSDNINKLPTTLKTSVGKNIKNNSFQNITLNSSSANTSTICEHNEQEVQSGSNTFEFSPVILKSNYSMSDLFSQSSSKSHSNSVQSKFSRPNNDHSIDLGNNNSKLVLSQASQLTVEEQSLVESVFDGIDADSLFDDDF